MKNNLPNNGECTKASNTAYHLTRSNSTASSTISLRLFRELCSAGVTATTSNGRVGLRPITHDDYFSSGGQNGRGGAVSTGATTANGVSDEHDEDYAGSSENMLMNMDESMSIGNNKSRHQSQNSQTSSIAATNSSNQVEKIH